MMKDLTMVISAGDFKRTIAGTGQPGYAKNYQDLIARDVRSLNAFEADACFAAGTLVHTQEGLKPIEDIKVGDMVLSKHESGEGERAYKRVTKTFVHEDREVILLGAMFGKPTPTASERVIKHLVVTPDHPIWVKGKGWKKAEKAKMSLDESVPFKFRMKEEHRYKTTVYNLEVEDFHAYYVTEDGIWVHNKNIAYRYPPAANYLGSDSLEGILRPRQRSMGFQQRETPL